MSRNPSDSQALRCSLIHRGENVTESIGYFNVRQEQC